MGTASRSPCTLRRWRSGGGVSAAFNPLSKTPRLRLLVLQVRRAAALGSGNACLWLAVIINAWPENSAGPSCKAVGGSPTNKSEHCASYRFL